MRITAAVVHAVGGSFGLEDLELDEPGPGEALVRIVATGICHTDEITRHGDLPMPFPGVLGHEGAGEVVAVGAGVTAVAPGDHVVIGWPSCGTCRNCRDGEPRYCARLGEALCGGGRLLGADAGAPALPLELLGPLACGISTGAGAVFNTLRPTPGSRLVVYGAGAVGLAAVMAARLSPATTIVAVDRHPKRLAMAEELGATDTVDATDVDPVAAIQEICDGPADYALECTGVIEVVRQAADSVGMLGTCVLIGGAPAGAEFSLDHLTTLWGKRIVGTLGGSGRSDILIPTLVRLHQQGRFPFDRLVEFYGLDQIDRALADSRGGDVLKPVLRMSTTNDRS